MREIKFRAWNKQEGCWIGGWSLRPDGYWSDLNGAHMQDGVCVAFSNWKPIEETPHVVIQQYTGLKDKHGKEIYEGDILYHDDIRRWPKTVRTSTAKRIAKYPHEPIVVEWMKDQAGFEPWASVDYESTTGYFSDEIEIVGNIYENPELVNVK